MKIIQRPSDGLRFWLKLRGEDRRDAVASESGLKADGVESLLRGEHKAPTLDELQGAARALECPVGDLGYRGALTVSETAESRTVVIASNEDVARDGDVVETSTLRLANYRTNPVILWSHDHNSPPVGKAESIDVEGTELRLGIQWHDSDKNPTGQLVAEQFRDGFLNAVSMGWIPGSLVRRSELDADHPHRGESGYVHRDSDVLEVSAVPVPSLQSAIAVQRSIAGNRFAAQSSDFTSVVREYIDAEIAKAINDWKEILEAEKRSPLDSWLRAK